MTILPGLLEQLEAETGIKVNFSTFDSNEMLETSCRPARPGTTSWW